MSNLNALPKVVFAYGFSKWKQQLLTQFLPNQKIFPVKRLNTVPNGATLLVWGHRKQKEYVLSPHRSINVVSVEDGFLRSVGLGVDYQIRPLSWVIDQQGLYFDSTAPSDLEHILLNYHFSEHDLCRAKVIRERIVKSGLTKYNIGQKNNHEIECGLAKFTTPTILVPGQVESDASLAYGAPAIRKNIELLQAVRSDNPNAYIIYKPHPDVVAGFRPKGNDENRAHFFCNRVITDTNMHTLLNYVDEVHLLTSLTGFEALLRNKKVVCYGQPFYAGWGLTIDKIPIPRRNRLLTLDELTAAALLIYPLYLSMYSDCLIDPESAIEELLNTPHPPQKAWHLKFVAFFHKLLKAF